MECNSHDLLAQETRLYYTLLAICLMGRGW